MTSEISSLEPVRVGFDRPSSVSTIRPGMTLLIAWRNLIHDKLRFAVTLIGIAFSTFLMGIQLGMLLNFMHTTSIIVDQAGADIWIAARGALSVDLATPIQERRRFQALSVPEMSVRSLIFFISGFGREAMDCVKLSL